MAALALSDLSFVVPCMGRLAHLARTLPRLVALAPAQVLVVDWNCPDRAGDWVEAQHPACRVLRVRDVERFNLAAARNAGAEAADTPWLCFVDADVLLDPAFAHVLDTLDPRGFYVAETPTPSLRGTVLCTRAAYAAVDGYDELMLGWGSEDTDFYRRLEMAGYTRRALDAGVLTPIPHEDALRTRHYDERDPACSMRLNAFYMYAKLDLMRLVGTTLSFTARRALRARIEAQVQAATAGRSPASLELPVAVQAFSDELEIRASLRYTLAPRTRR